MKSFKDYLEEQQSLMEYEYSVDDNGNAIDDEGNRFHSSRGAGVYGLHSRRSYSSYPRSPKFKTGTNIKWVSDDKEIVNEFVSELDTGYPITYSKRLTTIFDAVKKSCKNMKFTSVPKVALAGLGVLTTVCVTGDTEFTISKKDFASIANTAFKSTLRNEESFENISDNDWKAIVEDCIHDSAVAIRLFKDVSESIDSVFAKLKLKPVFRACSCRAFKYEVRVKGDTITICGKNAALWESEKLGTNLYKIMTNYLPTKLWAKFFKKNPHLSKR